MERDFKGIWIPKEIWLNKDLKIMEKLFLVEIDSLDCSERHCYASNDYFAKFFELSKNRCSEIIKSLEKKGLITIEYKYKENTKQIEERIIKVFDKSKGGIRNIDSTPSEKCEDNNITINNTSLYSEIVDKWNSIPELSNVVKLTDKRNKAIKAILGEYTQEEVLIVIDNIKNSDFLKGINNNNWKCSFDWILNKNNFVKILEGNYNKKKPAAKAKAEINFEDFIQ